MEGGKGKAESLTATQAVKLRARQFTAVAGDKFKVASASISRGDTQDVDVAVVKATTSQFHVPPKEKHVKTLKSAVVAAPAEPGKQRLDSYAVTEITKRLRSATDWLTALKTLHVFHRLMRECDMHLLQLLLDLSEPGSGALASGGRGSGRLFRMGDFIDTTNIEGRFEFSEFVRAYGKYLDEQLAVVAQCGWYQEQEQGGRDSRLRGLSGEALLSQMPLLQHLLSRLIDCRPTGGAVHDPVVHGAAQAALYLALKESFKLYKALSEGLINLADRFFEMDHVPAAKGLDVYREAIAGSNRLQGYYREMEKIEELKRAVQFPTLEPPPADFLAQMENYCAEAPRSLDDAVASKKRSPPLRRGSRLTGVGARPPREPLAPPAAPADPGMVLAVDKAATSGTPVQQPPPAPQAEPDLLGLYDAPAPATPTPAAPPGAPQTANANAGVPAGGASGGPHVGGAPTPSSTIVDPFGSPAAFGPSGGGSGVRPGDGNPFHAPQPASSNPFSSGGAALGGGGAPQLGGGLGAGAGSGQGTGGGAMAARPPAAAPGAGMAQRPSAPSGTSSAYRKDGALYDPFAELTSELARPPAKASPPLKAGRPPAASPFPGSGMSTGAGPLPGPAPRAAGAQDDEFGGSAFAPAAKAHPGTAQPAAGQPAEARAVAGGGAADDGFGGSAFAPAPKPGQAAPAANGFETQFPAPSQSGSLI